MKTNKNRLRQEGKGLRLLMRHLSTLDMEEEEEDENSDQSDTASDASYDIDDGTNATHVSCSGQRKSKNAEKRVGGRSSDSDEDDADLDAALNEHDGDDDKEVANGNADD